MLFLRLALLLGVSIGVDGMRLQHKANATSEEGSEFWCQDYCIQCNDGSTVWYGRSRSWFHAFVQIFTEGLLVPLTMIGNSWMKATKEEFSHWSGYLPTVGLTMGLSCEKVDIIKFPSEHNADNAFTPLMLADRNWLGRIQLNELKPYYPESHRPPKEWAAPHDYDAYVEGCKIIKGSAAWGKLSQFGSNFQDFCHSSVTVAAHKCAEHSRMCGAAGVKHLLFAESQRECMAWKNKDTQPICPYKYGQ